MKKLLFITIAALFLASCSNTTTNTENQMDSTAVISDSIGMQTDSLQIMVDSGLINY